MRRAKHTYGIINSKKKSILFALKPWIKRMRLEETIL